MPITNRARLKKANVTTQTAKITYPDFPFLELAKGAHIRLSGSGLTEESENTERGKMVKVMFSLIYSKASGARREQRARVLDLGSRKRQVFTFTK
jgi:hypothetical protein